MSAIRIPAAALRRFSAGRPTDDPAAMFAQPPGTLLPFGGYKGYGLSFLSELLAGALTGAGTMQPGTPRPGTITNNMPAIPIDPDHLRSPGPLAREVEDLVGYVHSTRPSEPGGQVLIPGEPESGMRRRRLAEGVPPPGRAASSTWRYWIASWR